MKERNYVVNRYRYINTLKQKFKAGQYCLTLAHLDLEWFS